ncbi:MAG: hypothetical protein ACRYGF_02400 [Janthinobacterium lividum]
MPLTPTDLAPCAAQSNYLSQRVETAVKASSLIVVAMAAVGFLIVSLNDGRYGFFAISFVRPRMVAAGFGFAVFLVIPSLAGWTAAAMPARTGLGAVNAFIERFGWLAVLTNVAVRTTNTFLKPLSGATIAPSLFWSLGPTSLAALFVIAVTLSDRYLQPSPIRQRLLGLLVSLELATILVVYFGPLFPPEPNIAHWIQGIGVLVFVLRLIPRQHLASQWRIASNLVFPLIIVSVFARYVYPKVDFSWGGGAPIPVTITFVKDFTGDRQDRHALLIDESDAGGSVALTLETRSLARG